MSAADVVVKEWPFLIYADFKLRNPVVAAISNESGVIERIGALISLVLCDGHLLRCSGFTPLGESAPITELPHLEFITELFRRSFGSSKAEENARKIGKFSLETEGASWTLANKRLQIAANSDGLHCSGKHYTGPIGLLIIVECMDKPST